VDAGSRRTAFYTRLPPGRYTFRVVASNHGDVWSEAGAPLQLALAPRFHETRGARLLLVLALALLVAAGVQWRLRQLRVRAVELARLVDERTAALRENEAQLEAQNQRLEDQAARLSEMDEAKSRLFANLSHEFRTPLTLILGPLRAVLDGRHGALAGGVREEGELMLRNAQRLLRLINQVLDLTKLQAGQVSLERRPDDLVGFARGVTRAFAPLAERRGISLGFRSDLAGLRFPFDAEQLEKVLLNLLSNALKFTNRGGEVEVVVTSDDGAATIAVRDTGVGIRPEEMERIFERFFQADASATRRYDGTGIGLALARELVELHGGEIGADSTPGEGSTFTVRLPLGDADVASHQDGRGMVEWAAADADAIAASVPVGYAVQGDDRRPDGGDDAGRAGGSNGADGPDGEPGDRTTVLVVDDHADVRAYVRSVLSASYRVLEAVDGRDGLERARAALPDLIVADVMMPELDGLALARALKGDAMTSAIPVVLLTARAAPEDQVAGLETGADAYLVKPFDPDVLEARVANLLAQRMRLREHFARVEAPTRAPLPEEGEPSPLERRLRPVVEAHLTDPDFGPDALAAAAGLSYHQLYRALRDELHTTPSRLIRRARVELASELLRARQGSVTEIAYSVGFNSLSYFSRAFRERFDASPSEHLGAHGAERRS
jgi:signal transduction histidine kinase/DNA-binding NarL/FixJ family response regulator